MIIYLEGEAKMKNDLKIRTESKTTEQIIWEVSASQRETNGLKTAEKSRSPLIYNSLSFLFL
jgi:hypothetical protein